MARPASCRGLALAACIALSLLASPAVVSAQDVAAEPPPEEPRRWTATLGGGLALTSGNTDSLTYNLAVDVALTSPADNVLRWTGLYLRGRQDDVIVVNKLALSVRNEYTFSPRVFVFGKVDYLHDTFKRIDYFVAPAIGLGYKTVDTPTTRFSIDLGAGSVTEQNPGSEAKTTGAIQAGEALQHDLNSTATIKHATTAVWNTNDFGNSLVTASIGLATPIASRFQLSVDLIDTFKTRPPTPATERNDINIIVAITAKY